MNRIGRICRIRRVRPCLAAALACLLGTACTRVTDDMARQARTDVGDASPLFADQQAARPPVSGTVLRASGDLAWMSSGRAGQVSEEEGAPAPVVDPGQQIAHGRDRYLIYCLPCHGIHGEGDCEVVERGFPAPPPFGGSALRATTDLRLHEAIRHGAGMMYPFEDRVSAEDAWALVAYIRALQRETPVPTAQLSASGARGAVR